MLEHDPPLSLEAYAGAIASAQAQLAAHDRDALATFQRMSNCLENHRARLNDNSIVSTFRKTKHQRCRELLCPICLEEKRNTLKAQILSRYEAALRDSPTLIPALIAFRSAPFRLTFAPQAIDDVIDQWQEFSYRKTFKSACSSYMRGLRLDINHPAGTAKATTSLLLLLDRAHLFPNAEAWLEAWNAAGIAPPSTLRTFALINPATARPDTAVVKFVTDLSTLAVHATRLCEGPRGGLWCDPAKLRLAQEALKKRRLIYAGGLFKPLD